MYALALLLVVTLFTADISGFNARHNARRSVSSSKDPDTGFNAAGPDSKLKGPVRNARLLSIPASQQTDIRRAAEDPSQQTNTRRAAEDPSQQTDRRRALSHQKHMRKALSHQKHMRRALSQQKDTRRAAPQQRDKKRVLSQQTDTRRALAQQTDTRRAASQLRNTRRATSQLRNTRRATSQLRNTRRAAFQHRDMRRAASQQRHMRRAASQQRHMRRAASQQRHMRRAASQQRHMRRALSQQTDRRMSVSQQIDRTVAEDPSQHKNVKRAAFQQTNRRRAANNQNQHFGVLLDAGSSSTKVNVFRYTPAKSPNFMPKVQLMNKEREKPGLKSFMENSDDITNYISRCLGHAIALVPEPLRATTPVYLMATAGLRTLSASRAKALLQSVRGVMSIASINPFYFEEDHVSILSGEEEAVYAWLAVNYLHGFFSTNMTRKDSVGLMEMGGGSLQVAFLPDVPIYQGEFQVYVGRRRFDLYAHSYLGFGSRYIGNQVIDAISRNGSSFWRGNELINPCMLAGDVSDYETSDGAAVKTKGEKGWSKCINELKSIMDMESSLCFPKPCGIRNIYQPAVGSLPFYAISAFYYAPFALHAIKQNDILDVKKLLGEAMNYCMLTVADAVKMTNTKTEFASNDCMVGLYIPLLLRHFGFELETDQITVTSSINGIDIHWSLGAMLQQLSMTFMDDLESAIQCRRGKRYLPLNNN